METLKKGSTAKEYSPNLYEVVFSPIMERAEYQKEPIRSKLEQLKELMGEDDFEQYINTLLKITYNGSALWLITRKELHRTIIEGKFIGHIVKAFGTNNVRIFTQS